MATDVKLPELGENITSAKVLDVLVAAGDTVEKDQSILSLESDKAEFDLPSPAAGKVTELLVKKGDDVEVGQLILRLDGAGADAAPKAVPAPRAAAPKRPAPTRKDDEDLSDVESGEDVQPQPPVQKAAPAAADEAERGDAGARPQSPQPSEGPATDALAGERRAVAAAPSVRRLARELGVDLAEVKGSESGGRISAEDVYRHVRAKLTSEQRGGAKAGEGERDYSHWGEVRIEKMSTVRRRTAEQMSRAWSIIPHVTHHDYADISELDRLRRQFAPRVERAGAKLTVTAVLLKVLGSALRRYPKFNASVDMESAEIIYKEFVNVGVAVDTERGLLVPVIRQVDEKNIVELALELHEVSEAARTRKIRPDMLQGATFTVTNLGGIGGTHFGPLINPPEVAVLGVSRASTRPVWGKDAFEPRFMLPLSVTYDHRIIDGADAARFLRWVCEALEEPFLMDLEGD